MSQRGGNHPVPSGKVVDAAISAVEMYLEEERRSPPPPPGQTLGPWKTAVWRMMSGRGLTGARSWKRGAIS